MNCQKFQKNIHLWLDRVMENRLQKEFEAHWKECAHCQRELEIGERFERVLRASGPTIEPSSNFEAAFWSRVFERAKKPRLFRFLNHLDALIPVPSFSQAVVVLLSAFLIGGTGGVLSAVNTLTPEYLEGKQTSVHYLSGFKEYKGIPATSVSATYLKSVEEGNT